MSIQSTLFRVAENSPAPVAPWIVGLALGRWPTRIRALPLETFSDLVAHCRKFGAGGELVLPAEAAAEIFEPSDASFVSRLRAALGDPEGRRFSVVDGPEGELFVSVLN